LSYEWRHGNRGAILSVFTSINVDEYFFFDDSCDIRTLNYHVNVDLRLSRCARLPLRDQLVMQIKRKILEGEWSPGLGLPSVRALARRLAVHPHTVLAAYRNLEADGHLTIRPGAGVRVGQSAGSTGDRTRRLEDILAEALDSAVRLGYTAAEMRAGVRAWLRSPTARRVLVADPSKATAEILAQELRGAVTALVVACGLDELPRQTPPVDNALLTCLPFYTETLRREFPRLPVRTLRLPAPPADLHTVPADGLALVVSHSARILPHAAALLVTICGTQLEVECRELGQRQEWTALASIADVVFADVVALPAVREARPARAVEFRLASADSLEEIRHAVELLVPRFGPPTAARARGAPAPAEPEYSSSSRSSA
jgi:GntR family transcriptional regulator